MPRRNGLPTFPGCQKVGSPFPSRGPKPRWQPWRPSPSSRSGQGPGLQSGTWKGCGKPVLMCPFAITRMRVMANGVEPMKLGLVADIHGDPVALELAWAHLITMKVDRIVCAGDLVGYGPFPDRVVTFLKERQIPSVRGNHDRWAVSRGPGAVDELGRGKPSLETLEYLGSLPADFLIEAGSRIGVVVHGSPSSDMEFVNRRTRPPSSDV